MGPSESSAESRQLSFFQQLTEKPWSAAGAGAANRHQGRAFALPRATLGLRVFLVVISVLFSLLIVGYADRMAFPDWRPLPEPWLLWLNTAIMALSSVGLHWACVGARVGRIDSLKTGLLAGGLLALAFLAGQLLAWRQLVDLGYYASSNPANAFFYLITALHGLHLLGGLVILGRTSAKVWRGADLDRVRSSVELCAVYWHFLLVVWLVMFGLMLFT